MGMVLHEINVTINSHDVKLTSMLTTLSDKHLYRHNMQFSHSVVCLMIGL